MNRRHVDNDTIHWLQICVKANLGIDPILSIQGGRKSVSVKATFSGIVGSGT